MEKLNFTTPRVSVDEESYGIVSKPVYLRDEESDSKAIASTFSPEEFCVSLETVELLEKKEESQSALFCL